VRAEVDSAHAESSGHSSWSSEKGLNFFLLGLGILIPIFGMILLSSCASSYLKKTDSTNQAVRQVALSAVQYYRPDFEPAETDDFSHKSRVLSCIPPQGLYSDLLEGSSTAGIVECLNSLGPQDSVRYRFQSKTQPYFDLDPLDTETPACITQTLPQIILPREIYFLGKRSEGDRLECFSTSFSTKANQILDAELRLNRFTVQINFPLPRKLKDARDLKLWLITTIFSVLNEGKEEFALPASAVPDSVCNACFAHDLNFIDKKNGKIDAVLWP
jgi:hypothetical protein